MPIHEQARNVIISRLDFVEEERWRNSGTSPRIGVVPECGAFSFINARQLAHQRSFAMIDMAGRADDHVLASAHRAAARPDVLRSDCGHAIVVPPLPSRRPA
jgi:hypothetical protein